MCGIVGYTGLQNDSLIHRMMDLILHRGPDENGVAAFPDVGVHMGMRRLSIVDIEGGTQPFVSADGKVTLIFNGEIYNHREIRKILLKEGVSFKSDSDTETVLYAYLKWGENAWNKLNGMFALCVFDRRGGLDKLILTRDRFGIKPLYYQHTGKRLSFSSELKALHCLPDFKADILSSSLSSFLMHRYIPGPKTIFQDVYKLQPGHSIVFDVSAGKVEHKQWWHAPDYQDIDQTLSLQEATNAYGEALRQSIGRHMLSDVPLGAYLSGGIDSTMIAALMAETSSAPINTFSIGFPGFQGSELKQAEETANYIGSHHTSLLCEEEELKNLPDIVYALDEPFGDAIILPMYALARETRKQVKVVLSGEGADETLGGYLFTRKLVLLDKLKNVLPSSSWPLLSHLFSAVPLPVLEALFDYPGNLGTFGKEKLKQFLREVGTNEIEELNRVLITLFDKQDIEAHTFLKIPQISSTSSTSDLSSLQRLLNSYLEDWLPDEILAKYDRITMAHSLEGRVPFVDDRVLQAASHIPDKYKVNGDANKIVLREFAKSMLPQHLLNRPKAAFYTPLETYKNTKIFKEYMKNYLHPERLKKRGILAPGVIERLLSEPSSAGFLPLKQVFSVLMLELWFERFCPDYQYEPE